MDAEEAVVFELFFVVADVGSDQMFTGGGVDLHVLVLCFEIEDVG